jgi:hypothetical protein
MSFDTTYTKIGLQEAAAKYFIIREQSITNDRLALTEFNFSQNEAIAAITAFLLQALCKVSAVNKQFNSSYCLHSPILKDDPFTREKLKI